MLEVSADAAVTRPKIKALLNSQHFRCAMSGRELTPETASLDHIVPIARGGTHSIDNVQILQWQVNSAKGTMDAEEFLAMCFDVALHHGWNPPS